MIKAAWETWANDLSNRISEWLKEESTGKDNGYSCKRCGKDLMNRTVYCSIHEAYSLFKGSHAGGGSVHTFQIPECPNEDCQNHRPSFWDSNLQLDDRDTMRGPCIDY